MKQSAFLSGVCGVTLLLAGCRDKTPPRPEKEPSKASVPATPTSASQLPASAVSTEAAPSGAPAPRAIPVEYGAPIACAIVATDPVEGWPALRLHALQGAFLATRGSAMYRIEDDKLVDQKYDFVADHPTQEFVTLSGRYPDAISGTALVGEAMTSERGNWYSWGTEDVFGPIEQLVVDSRGGITGTTWLQGSRLIFDSGRFKAVRAGANAVVPTLPPSPERDCQSLFGPYTYAAALDGSVVAVGRTCGALHQPVAERWEAGKSDGRVLPMPSQASLPSDVGWGVVLGPGRLSAIIASGKESSTLWRETSTTFQELATPVLPDAYSIAVGVEGELWLVARPVEADHKRARAFLFDGKRWSELTLPKDPDLRAKLPKVTKPETLWLRPNNFAVRGDKVYLAANVMQGSDQTVAAMILTPLRGSKAGADATADEAEEPADLGCVPQVVLFAVSKTTPADYQYPATRDAIVGSRFATSAEFLEVTRGGQRTLIAKTKTRKEAKALAEHIKERIAGSKPAAVCEPAPEVIRSISMR